MSSVFPAFYHHQHSGAWRTELHHIYQMGKSESGSLEGWNNLLVSLV